MVKTPSLADRNRSRQKLQARRCPRPGANGGGGDTPPRPSLGAPPRCGVPVPAAVVVTGQVCRRLRFRKARTALPLCAGTPRTCASPPFAIHAAGPYGKGPSHPWLRCVGTPRPPWLCPRGFCGLCVLCVFSVSFWGCLLWLVFFRSLLWLLWLRLPFRLPRLWLLPLVGLFFPSAPFWLLPLWLRRAPCLFWRVLALGPFLSSLLFALARGCPCRAGLLLLSFGVLPGRLVLVFCGVFGRLVVGGVPLPLLRGPSSVLSPFLALACVGLLAVLFVSASFRLSAAPSAPFRGRSAFLLLGAAFLALGPACFRGFPSLSSPAEGACCLVAPAVFGGGFFLC